VPAGALTVAVLTRLPVADEAAVPVTVKVTLLPAPAAMLTVAARLLPLPVAPLVTLAEPLVELVQVTPGGWPGCVSATWRPTASRARVGDDDRVRQAGARRVGRRRRRSW
jgi:hypothetical protein